MTWKEKNIHPLRPIKPLRFHFELLTSVAVLKRRNTSCGRQKMCIVWYEALPFALQYFTQPMHKQRKQREPSKSVANFANFPFSTRLFYLPKATRVKSTDFSLCHWRLSGILRADRFACIAPQQLPFQQALPSRQKATTDLRIVRSSGAKLGRDPHQSASNFSLVLKHKWTFQAQF